MPAVRRTGASNWSRSKWQRQSTARCQICVHQKQLLTALGGFVTATGLSSRNQRRRMMGKHMCNWRTTFRPGRWSTRAAILLIMLTGLVTGAYAQNGAYANAELHVTGFSPITCVEKRTPDAGHDEYDMDVHCSATVSGRIEYIHPPNVRYRITAEIDNRGDKKEDLPGLEAPHNDEGLMHAGTGDVTVPVSAEYSIPIEPWNKKSDYCQAGSYPATVGISVAIPIDNGNGEVNESDGRDVTVSVTCTGG